MTVVVVRVVAAVGGSAVVHCVFVADVDVDGVQDIFSNKFFPIRFYVSQSTIEFCVVKSITHIYIVYIVSLFNIFSKIFRLLFVE